MSAQENAVEFIEGLQEHRLERLASKAQSMAGDLMRLAKDIHEKGVDGLESHLLPNPFTTREMVELATQIKTTQEMLAVVQQGAYP